MEKIVPGDTPEEIHAARIEREKLVGPPEPPDGAVSVEVNWFEVIITVSVIVAAVVAYVVFAL